MSASGPIHVLALTATAERARRIGGVVRAQCPEVVLHGPFARVAEAAAYEPEARIDYAVVDHRLDDGFGIDYWRYAPRSFARAIVVLEGGDDGAAYAKQSILTVRAERLDAGLGTALQVPPKTAPATWMQASTARWCALDLAGERRVYRRRILQEVEPWDDGPTVVMPMPASVIAHFYADEGRVWAAAASGNLNACRHTLDELEATLRPELWCRINDRQLIGAVALAPHAPYDGERVNLQVTSPLRDVVAPERRPRTEQWLAGADAAFFDPDDEEELTWG